MHGVAYGGVANASGMHKVGDLEVSCMMKMCGKVWGVVRVYSKMMVRGKLLV